MTGTIDQHFTFAKICHDATCTDFGTVNFKPTINEFTSGATPVVITDSGITGFAWGDEIGWINLAPSGAGITVNPETGALSGMAWAHAGSWIHATPTGQGVAINEAGEFEGYAWVSGMHGGWLYFNCADPDACVKTDWLPISARANEPNEDTGTGGGTGGGGGGGGGGGTSGGGNSSEETIFLQEQPAQPAEPNIARSAGNSALFPQTALVAQTRSSQPATLFDIFVDGAATRAQSCLWLIIIIAILLGALLYLWYYHRKRTRDKKEII